MSKEALVEVPRTGCVIHRRRHLDETGGPAGEAGGGAEHYQRRRCSVGMTNDQHRLGGVLAPAPQPPEPPGGRVVHPGDRVEVAGAYTVRKVGRAGIEAQR